MNKLFSTILLWVVCGFLFVVGLVVIFQGFTGGGSEAIFTGLTMMAFGGVGLFVAKVNGKYQKQAIGRLVDEFQERGINDSNLPGIESALYDRAAGAIALVTKMYLQKQPLPDSQQLFTTAAMQTISNGLANLNNPVYSQVNKMVDSVAKFGYSGLSVEASEEFHMNYLLGKVAATESYDAKLAVGVAGVPVASVATSITGKYVEYTAPVGKITDIQGNNLTFTISYSTTQAGKHDMWEDVVSFDITDFGNPKVSSISNRTQINNIFQLGNTMPAIEPTGEEVKA